MSNPCISHYKMDGDWVTVGQAQADRMQSFLEKANCSIDDIHYHEHKFEGPLTKKYHLHLSCPRLPPDRVNAILSRAASVE